MDDDDFDLDDSNDGSGHKINQGDCSKTLLHDNYSTKDQSSMELKEARS